MKKIIKILSLLMALSTFACQNQESSKEETTITESAKTMQDFSEKHRPQLHFTPPTKWMNDPNGMFFYEGEYHLFYQHYPDSTVWGPMHWGHAVSEDLIHWEHLPIALYPDSLGYIFSGSAVVDWDNSTGFGTEENPPLVAMFTYHDPVGEKKEAVDFQSQAIAYSLDKGRSWNKYKNNPVIPNPGIRDFRDPKVIWHADSEQWVMILAAQNQVKIYNSADLKSWTLGSEFGKEKGSHGGVWECPDLFPLYIDGSAQEKWVMIVSIGSGAPNGGSGTQYFIGDFDGKTFTPDQEFDQKGQAHWLDYGTDNYAGVTWSDIPEGDDRRIFIGWMSNWDYATVVPTNTWRSAMTLPRRLFLKGTPKGLRLCSLPVKEFTQVINEEYIIEIQKMQTTLDLTDKIAQSNGLFEVELTIVFDPGKEQSFGVILSNEVNDTLKLGYTHKDGQFFFIDRTQAGETNFKDTFAAKHQSPRFSATEEITFRIIVDVASVELFADQGEVVMTDIFFPRKVMSKLSLYSESEIEIKSGKVRQLESVWNSNK